MAGRRRTVGVGLIVAGVAVAVAGVVAWLASGVRTDLAVCDGAADSVVVMACGLTRISVGSAVVAVGAVALGLLALGSWLSLVGHEGAPD